MKRSAAIILSLIMLFIYSPFTFAESTVLYGGSIESIVHSAGEAGLEYVVVNLQSDKDYAVMKLSNPDRLVVNIQNAQFPYKTQTANVNSKYVRSIRHAQYDSATVRVVVDLDGSPASRVEKGIDQIIVTLGASDEAIAQSAPAASPAVDETQPATNGNSSDRDSGLSSRGGIDRSQLINLGKLNIDHAVSGTADEIMISLGSSKKYNVMRLTDPERIVVDLPNISAPVNQQEISVNGGQVKSIRYASLEKNAARVVLDVSGQSQYKIKESGSKLALNVESSKLKNVTYHNNGDRVYLSLDGATLTEGGEVLKNLYTGKYDETGKKYTVTFPTSQTDLGSGILNINDSYLDSIEVVNDINAGTTSIIFNAKNKYVYRTMARPDINDSAITILKPAVNSEKLVVIDAGHGGIDPGAISGGLKEKDLNLDIATRLNNLLISKKIRTYMLREDDRFVGLYERAYIANDLNATLFMSIHNNAIGDPNYGGTMTLYYPPRSSTGFTGLDFAKIVQAKLLGGLKTTDRKLIQRPNLVVLKATTMPSALAEVAFLTNGNDRSRLQTPAFRQNAAQALCDAIVQALAKKK